MKLEDICVSLELAKKLKKIGLPQKGLFHWVINQEGYHIKFLTEDEKDFANSLIISAYTADELLQFIPDNAFINISQRDLYYSPEHGTDNSYTFIDNSLADRLVNAILAIHQEGELKL